MPTLKAYANDPGYYINARPPNIGNITYQLTDSATTFITDLGYGDEDDLPWGLISPLRGAGHVYTHNQGPTSGDETPDLDGRLLPELTDREARKLLAYLSSKSNVHTDILSKLQQNVDTRNSETTSSRGGDKTEATSTSESGPGLPGLFFVPRFVAEVEQELDSEAEVNVSYESVDNEHIITIEFTQKIVKDRGITQTHELQINPEISLSTDASPKSLSQHIRVAERKAAILRALNNSDPPFDLPSIFNTN